MNYLTRRSAFPGFEAFGPGLAVFEDTLNRFFNEAPAARPWTPAVDIVETKDELILTADVPGMKMEDIEIKIEDSTLSLTGKREFQKVEEKGGYHRIERSYGTFQRAFSLPETVDTEQVAAQYEHGVLRVTLPKKEVAKPKTIKVSLGSKN